MEKSPEIPTTDAKLHKDPEKAQNDLPRAESDPPLTEGKTNKSTLFILSAIILLLLFVAAGALVYAFRIRPTKESAAVTATTQPTSSPVAAVVPSTKTYTNIKRSYSVEYPSNWRVREFTDPADGAAFSPLNKENDPANESITVNVMRRLTDDPNLSFEDYVKIAAKSEIQNYTKLASLKKIVTDEGVTGYETTWMVQPLMGQAGGPGESLPITYFALPYNTTATLQFSLGQMEDLGTYESMIKSLKMFGQAPAPTSIPTVDDSQLIREALFKANNWPASWDVTVKISTDDGTYASGTTGGGYFFAAKVNGVWEIVAAGNGVITCESMKKYPDFPKTLISECYDEATGQSVKR